MFEYNYNILSVSEVKKWICKLVALLCSYLSWAFGLGLSMSQSWRMWEFNSFEVPVVFIGLWEAYYYHKVNISGSAVEVSVTSMINGSWVIPREFLYGRDLILLANCMKSIVLIFCSITFVVSWIKAPYPDFLCLYNNISAFCFFLGCGSTACAVSLNFAVDFYGKSTLDFPPDFPVKIELLTKKHFTYVFPLGILTSILSLIGACMCLWDVILTQQGNQVKPLLRAKNLHDKL